MLIVPPKYKARKLKTVTAIKTCVALLNWHLTSPRLSILTSDVQVIDFTPLLFNVSFFCLKPYLKALGKCFCLCSPRTKVTYSGSCS